MNFWLKYDGGLFAAGISAKKFRDLPATDRLVLAVSLVRSPNFVSVYDTPAKIDKYLLDMVNKRREEGDAGYVNEEQLAVLVTEVVASGKIAKDELGPIITQGGIDHLQDQKKKKHWWHS
jgi:hypothetical protein